MKYWNENRWLLFTLFILVFFLLREWLLPVMELTDTNYLTLFLVFIALCLTLGLFPLKWWITGPVKLFYIGWTLTYVYKSERQDGITFLLDQALTNMAAIFSGNFGAITDPFRTVLFFVLLWMTVYLINHWIIVRHTIFLFYVLTVIFIAVLDTFSPYEGNSAILRVMLIGLLLTGFLKVTQMVQQHQLKVAKPKMTWVFVPLAFFVGLSGVSAYFLPKADPVWPDPVPYLRSFAEGAGSGPQGGVGKIGYDEDDTRLGGSFIGDDSVVFTAAADSGQYWKIETKDTYTTRGWEQSTAIEDVTIHGFGDQIQTEIVPGPEDKKDTAAIDMELTYPFIVQPYGLIQVEGEGTVTLNYEHATQKLKTYEQGQEIDLKEYGVVYSEPSYSLKALRATTVDDLAELPDGMERFLQLPDGLPERVIDLAEQVTADSTSLYEKARSIERYFSQNRFIYDQTNIPVPEEGQDYVDQFLFETQRGYCDNFSTSMTVMLRSIGIPARWVKGFAEGEEIGTKDGQRIYEVTNNNAHSWVEAYFPGIGWMPFEPTIGFSGASNINFDLDLTQDDSTDPTLPDQKEKPTPEETKKDESPVAAFSFKDWFGDTMGNIEENKGKIVLWSLLGAFLLSVLYRIRAKWLPKVLIPAGRLKKGNWKTFESGYMRLLKQLELYGLKREDGQTLSLYAKQIDSYFGTKDMKVLTEAYEKGLYGGKIEDQQWRQLRESWENLINRTGS